MKQAFSLRVINLQQDRTCFSLLKYRVWSQRIPGVLVVNISIWVLRVVVTKVVRLSWHSSPGRMKLLRGSLSVNFLLENSLTFNTWLFCNSSLIRFPFRGWWTNLANQVRLRVSPYLRDRQTRTDLTTNFLQKSDKLVYGSLVLLAPDWTVVKIALCRWSRHWAPRHASTRASFGGVAQCLLIGNVTWEVVLDERIEEEDVSVERSCASANMDDMAMDLFCTTTQPWNIEPCIQGCELCVHWDNCVQKCKQFCEELNRNTLPTGETNMSFSSGRTDKKQNKGTLQRHSSLRSRTCWGPSIQIPTRSVHQTFQARDHESSSRCAFHISILPTRSRTCFVIRTEPINIRRDGDSQSLWPASSENVLVNLLLLHCGHYLWDWDFSTWLAQAAD